MVSAWLLVPVKGLACGKGRLGGCLDARARRALNRYFLQRTLAVARAFPGAARTLVVSECARTLRVATDAGARVALQRAGTGLNRAVAEGADALRRLGAGVVVVLPADLPMLQARDVRALAAAAADPGSAALCPDKHGTGTNGLAHHASACLRTRFGEGSFAAHWQEALRAGVEPRRHVAPRIAFDVDTIDDLAQWWLAGGARELAGAARADATLRELAGGLARAVPDGRPAASRTLSR